MFVDASKGVAAKAGVQGSEAEAQHMGEAAEPMTNVKLMSIHEFGATIRHPGGTPYKFAGAGSARSGGQVLGRVIFTSKGDPAAVGETRPHTIQIPERAPLRTAFDKNVRAYDRRLVRIARTANDIRRLRGEMHLLGEKYRGDIIRGIKRGLEPPLAASTIRGRGESPRGPGRRRAGRSVPLWNTGQLVGSISVVLE